MEKRATTGTITNMNAVSRQLVTMMMVTAPTRSTAWRSSPARSLLRTPRIEATSFITRETSSPVRRSAKNPMERLCRCR